MALSLTLIRGVAVTLLYMGFGSPPVAAATPEDGRRAYDAGNFTDAMGIWAELGRQGEAEAEFGLGLLYDLGNGTPEDPFTAFNWYKMAAESGLPAAQFNVGAMYDSGRGVAQSSEEAALWYAKAAANGHHRAQFDLGQLYQHGAGVPRNPDVAAAWFGEAAAGGLPAAAIRLRELKAIPARRQAGRVTAVTLVSPALDASLLLTDGHPTLELVWVAPPEPQTVHYEVQVRSIGDPTPNAIFTASVTTTATTVRLPPTPGNYVWNVDTVGRDGTHTLGNWGRFSVDVLQHTGSMASTRKTAQPDH